MVYSDRRESRRCNSYVLVLVATAAAAGTLQSSFTDAAIINGSSMSIDQAIMAASQSSRVFRLMEDANVVRVEMDMLFHTDVWESMMRERENGTRRHRRKTIRDRRFRWPGAVIPYQMTVAFSSGEMQQFNDALADYHRYTCIRFRQAVPADRDYVRIIDGGGCFSFVGRGGGEQRLSLSSGCRYKGIIIHELGHAVGFHHEQTRPDRDQYVQIVQENIDSFMLYNFQKYTPAEVDVLSVPYDYLSVMHYGEYAFSHNGQRSIRTRDPAFQNRIGSRGGFSFRDIKAANLMYSCADRSGCAARSCPGEGFVGRDCTCWCPSGNDARPVVQCSGGETQTTRSPTTAARQTRPGQTTAATNSPQTSASYTTRHCHDANAMCRSWAEGGECNANPRYMLTHCAASCRVCGNSGGGGGYTMPTVQPPACRNVEIHCDYWKERGYCQTPMYAAYMQLNCPLACGVCSPQPAAATPRAATRATAAAPASTTHRTPASAAATRPPSTTARSVTSSALRHNQAGTVIRQFITSAIGKVAGVLSIDASIDGHRHGQRGSSQHSTARGGRPTLAAVTSAAASGGQSYTRYEQQQQQVDSRVSHHHRHRGRHHRHGRHQRKARQ